MQNLSSVETAGDVKPRAGGRSQAANRRTWGMQTSGGSSSSSNSAGSWIRSVFSASSSSSSSVEGVGGQKRGGAGGRGGGGGRGTGTGGAEPFADVVASSDSTSTTDTTPGPFGGDTPMKSPSSKRGPGMKEVSPGFIPAARAGTRCLGQDGPRGQGTAPILHARTADRLAPQVRYTCVVRLRMYDLSKHHLEWFVFSKRTTDRRCHRYEPKHAGIIQGGTGAKWFH